MAAVRDVLLTNKGASLTTSATFSVATSLLPLKNTEKIANIFLSRRDIGAILSLELVGCRGSRRTFSTLDDAIWFWAMSAQAWVLLDSRFVSLPRAV